VQQVLLPVQTSPAAQSAFTVHWTHAPVLVLHALMPTMPFATHCALVVHAVQVFAEQMGVVPEQEALVTHATHMFVLTSQEPIAPVHWVVLVLVHFTHEPLLLQAGAVAPLRALHSLSPVGDGFAVQARHANDAGSQMGVVAVGHWVERLHATQAPLAA